MLSLLPLIIHSDLNGTLCVGDSTKLDSYQDSVDLNLKATLAKYLKGRLKDDKFTPHFEPALLPIESNESESSLSYKEYLQIKMDKKSREKQTGDILKTFPELQNSYKMLTDQMGNSFLLPSARQMFSFLKVVALKRSVFVFIRTFGKDHSLLQSALKEIGLDLTLVTKAKKEKEKEKAQNKEKEKEEKKEEEEEENEDDNPFTFQFFQEILNKHTQNTLQVYFIQDDFNRWNNHKQITRYGKPFPLFENAINIFFDDNENIVCPINSKNEYVEDPTVWRNVHLVNTSQSILNLQYFVNVLLEQVKTQKQSKVQMQNLIDLALEKAPWSIRILRILFHENGIQDFYVKNIRDEENKIIEELLKTRKQYKENPFVICGYISSLKLEKELKISSSDWKNDPSVGGMAWIFYYCNHIYPIHIPLITEPKKEEEKEREMEMEKEKEGTNLKEKKTTQPPQLTQLTRLTKKQSKKNQNKKKKKRKIKIKTKTKVLNDEVNKNFSTALRGLGNWIKHIKEQFTTPKKLHVV